MSTYTPDRKSFFKDFSNQITFTEKQTSNKVKRIWLNNTLEFVSSQVKELCKSKSIRLELTMYYILEQNSESERSMRIIIEAERSELEDA